MMSKNAQPASRARVGQWKPSQSKTVWNDLKWSQAVFQFHFITFIILCNATCFLFILRIRCIFFNPHLIQMLQLVRFFAQGNFGFVLFMWSEEQKNNSSYNLYYLVLLLSFICLVCLLEKTETHRLTAKVGLYPRMLLI